MNKELECLKRIDTKNYLTEREHREFYSVVEQALLELKSIKEANPSEALEAFGRITLHTEYDNDNYDGIHFEDDCNLVDKALLKAEKDEKIILGIEDYLNQRIKAEPLGDVRKAFIEIINQLQVIKEVLE